MRLLVPVPALRWLAISFALISINFLWPAAAHAVCLTPAGVEGEIIYNSDHKVYQYCDDAGWVMMRGGSDVTVGNMTQVVPSGLVGHWRLDGNANDSSVVGNNGSAIGSVSWPNDGVVSTSADIGGGISRIVVPQHAAINSLDQITITAWVKGVTGGSGRVVSKDGEFGIIGSPSLQRLDFQANRWNTQGGWWRTPNNILPGGGAQWNHIAVTYDYSSTANDAQWYINGQLITSGISKSTPVGTPQISTSDLYIGNWSTPVNSWNNQIDDVRIYNRILTAAEITEIFNARDGVKYNREFKTMEYFDGNRSVSMTRTKQDVTSGLMGHWKLDETTGTTAVDSSGNGRNGTMVFGLSAASDSASGAVGKAIHFDGSDDMITVPDFMGAQSAATITAWVRKNAKTNAYTFYHIAGQASDSNTNYIMSLSYEQDSADSINATVRTAGGDVAAYVVPPPREQWFHVAGVYDGAALRLYVNGALADTQAQTGNLINSSNVFTIGRKWDTAVYPAGAGAFIFDGAIDDVRAYNRALTPAEVQTLYNMGVPTGENTALPQGCSVLGDVCDDGTIYAGLSPDGNIAMYAAPFDAPTTRCWNNCQGATAPNSSTTGATSYTTGRANTNTIMSIDSNPGVAGFQNHNAARYCYLLQTGGADDWYLPGQNELDNLYNSGNPLGGVDSTPGIYYWTSTENSQTAARRYTFENNSSAASGKSYSENVRCMRKGPAPRCANPYGMEGQIIYNQAHKVVQYCDGVRWTGIGK